MLTYKQYLKTMPNRHFRRFVLGLCRIFVRLLYRLKYEGLDNIPQKGSFILVGNHTSTLDMLAIQTVMLPWVHWVAKKELFGSKLSAKVYQSLGCIPVDRDKADLVAARGIIKALRSGHVVGIFPQGTRVPIEQVPHVKPRSGMTQFAAKTDSPILPVAVSGPFKVFGKVRIVFGKPFSISMETSKKYSARELDEMTVDVMRNVYRLIDYDFHPAYQLGESEQ